jgi:hypothetical protein
VTDDDLWPVTPSEAVAEALADPALSVALFSKIVALTVSIAENPWLAGSSPAAQGGGWRTVPIPDGGGLVEYLINEAEHSVLLTRIAPF